ncbi:MAG: bifunctional diaminohydroxyphosphoribosylaminopyrimidine deaminase/5-amino-6-(5-phosphoribosylamino)uracil reductase RibD [Bdellovibrionales bacterium]|nr:bifunctional diaminohydroxyphosphoribosylaminopyrimidine deaminase/5-amino-6-(5-phosphoribosylamino)uracil reductase RibD [Bdellovibrionales bacterium]
MSATIHSDTSLMDRALALARRGSGFTAPNPLVGAVVARDGEILGSGWHRKAGEAHAEIEALRAAGEKAKGATLYVTLEPCNHFGRTPPCTNAIVESGITKVFVAMRDPNPKVKGGGIAALRERGVEVDLGLLGERAIEMNRGWIHWAMTGRPFVLLKLAASLDGKVAASSGESKWISSLAARAHVQRLRRHVHAVLVGSGTVANDNPRLTNRTGKGPQPLRVIVDSTLRTDINANVYRPLGLGERGRSPICLIATTSRASYQRRRDLELAGVEIVSIEGDDGEVDLAGLVDHLGQLGIHSVMCEGGARLAAGLLQKGLVNRFMLYQGPVLLGTRGLSWFNGSEIEAMRDAPRLELMRSRTVGPDNMLLCRVKEPDVGMLLREAD